VAAEGGGDGGRVGGSFGAAAAALRPGGRFAFTIERADDAERGAVLRATARYAHAPSYVRDLAGKQGLIETAADEAPLRLDGGAPISGVTFVFQKNTP